MTTTPDYAVSVWVAGSDLMVAFPGTRSEQGHTIRLPISEAGLKTVIRLLRDREQAQDLRISQPGTPSQWDSEIMLNDAKYKAWRADSARAKAEKEEAIKFLEDLGL